MAVAFPPDTDVRAIVNWASDDALAAPRSKALPWSEQEDRFLRANLGVLSEDEIGARLGRTPTAVHLRWSRDLGLPAPSKAPGYLTAHQAARALGVDLHAVCRWIEELGMLKAHLLPFPGRKMWRLRVEDLDRFAIKPQHWIFFEPEAVRDPRLARLVALAVARWDDAWLAPGEVAEMHGVDHRDVNRFIHAGKLPATKWGNWHILRSDAEKVYFPKGRGSGHARDWPEEGDVFLVLARAVGLSTAAIDRSMRTARTAAFRLKALQESGQIPLLVGKYGVDGVRQQEDGTLLADWQLHRDRFPAVARAMDRFAAGAPLSPAQAEIIRGVLWAWAAFHLSRAHPLTRRLQIRGRRIDTTRLETLYQQLRALGVDPLEEKT